MAYPELRTSIRLERVYGCFLLSVCEILLYNAAKTKASPTQGGVHIIIMHSTRLPFRTEWNLWKIIWLIFIGPSYCRVFPGRGVPIQMISQWGRTANINGVSPQSCGACKYDVILYTGIRNCLGNHNVDGRGPVVLLVGRLCADDRLIEKQKQKQKTRAKPSTVYGTWRNYNFPKLTPNTAMTYPVRPHIMYGQYWINAIRRRLTPHHDAEK